MGRRVHNLVTDIIFYIDMKDKNSYATSSIIKSAISNVLVIPYEFIEGVHVESNINSQGINIDENREKVREYIRKMIIEVIKSYIKKQYIINDFILIGWHQKVSISLELVNWKTIFEALGLEVIKKPLPGKKDIERVARALWGEKALQDAIEHYQMINSPEVKRKKTISEIKKHYTLLEFMNSSTSTLKEKKGMGWLSIATILGLKFKYGNLTVEKKYEIANIVWNPEDVDTIRKYKEYIERTDVKKDMIIHGMKNQYTQENFMCAQIKELNKDKVNGQGWKAICTILNVKSSNYLLTMKKREAVANKVWKKEGLLK